MRIRFLIRTVFSLFVFLITHNSIFSISDNILLINSYHKGLSWSDDVVSGIEHKFREDYSKEYNLFVEYLDSKRYNKDDFDKLYFDYFKKKYSNTEFDLIIANDDRALSFLESYKKDLFGNCPVVFTGTNTVGSYPSGYTGLYERVDIKANINLIQKLHPDINRLFFIIDNTKTGRILQHSIKSIVEKEGNPFRYFFLTDYTYEELFEKVRNLKNGDVIFLGIFTEDQKGAYFSFNRFINNLHAHSSVPIYSAWDFYLGKGIVGGKIIQGHDYGIKAAAIAFDILEGIDVNSIPDMIMPSDYIFDYPQLKKHNISLKQLPDNSTIINSPYNFFKDNQGLFISLLIVIILLLIVIVILLRYNRVKKQRLSEQDEYLRKIEKINKDLETAKEKAQEANRLKTSFLANISHEIRTPLNAIIGFSRLITDKWNLSRETQNKYHNLLKVNSDLLLNLINDIIDLSKIETKQLNLSFKDFDLNELFDNISDYTKDELNKTDKKDIEVHLDKGIRKDTFYIRTDDARLRQVMINLINNAIKFTYHGKITIGYRITGEHLLLYVKDTGIGLSKSEYKYIFESFRQGEEGTTKKFGGAGLGLTLSKGIVDNLKGKIWCESSKGNGAEFYVQVPFKTSSKHKIRKSRDFESQMEDQYNWDNKNILVVEDSQMSYELITKLLKGTGAVFSLETDGLRAIERCRSDQSIDLVLMDIQLPYLDGYEATRKIKEIRPDLPIVAQTANAMLDDRKKALESGCEDYIAKPLDRMELAEKINKLLFKIKNE